MARGDIRVPERIFSLSQRIDKETLSVEYVLGARFKESKEPIRTVLTDKTIEGLAQQVCEDIMLAPIRLGDEIISPPLISTDYKIGKYVEAPVEVMDLFRFEQAYKNARPRVPDIPSGAWGASL